MQTIYMYDNNDTMLITISCLSVATLNIPDYHIIVRSRAKHKRFFVLPERKCGHIAMMTSKMQRFLGVDR